MLKLMDITHTPRREGPFATELAFFIDHQSELVEKYDGHTLVIRGESVAGVYDSPLEAYLEARKRFVPGSYMIQPCAPGPAAYTVSISSIDLTDPGARNTS